MQHVLLDGREIALFLRVDTRNRRTDVLARIPHNRLSGQRRFRDDAGLLRHLIDNRAVILDTAQIFPRFGIGEFDRRLRKGQKDRLLGRGPIFILHGDMGRVVHEALYEILFGPRHHRGCRNKETDTERNAQRGHNRLPPPVCKLCRRDGENDLPEHDRALRARR